MYRRFHDRFGSAGVVIAVIALIAALGGTALAAGALSSKQKREVEKIAKKFAGKPGATGPQGPAGPAGTNGTNGKEGPQGKEGIQGVQGKEGEPWTVGGTLPEGKTLKGEWFAGGHATEGNQVFRSAVSYALPLAAAPTTHFIRKSGVDPTGCTGSVTNPGAAPGNLCVFAAEENNSLKELVIPSVIERYYPGICAWQNGSTACGEYPQGGEGEGSRFGFGISAVSEAEGEVDAFGSWAVTAE